MRVAFVCTEDWFFASHFLPMAVAAREAGLAVDVITRVGAHREAIAETGAHVLALQSDRSSLNPLTAGFAAGTLAAILKDRKPAIVHCIALRSILLGGAACALAGIDRRVYALTGLGYLGAACGATTRIAGRAVRGLLAGPLRTGRTRFLFENEDDPALLGLAPTDPAVAIVGGAGIDPERLRPGSFPPVVPLRVATVSRMVWSKGVDLAVEAVRLARADGIPVELSLHGAPDPRNPRAIPERRLREWNTERGIAWRGSTTDVAAVWAENHLAIFPSRGGEGLPRSMLEAAACGRPILTTDVPGCRRFVRDGREGLVVPPNNPRALADALARFARQPELVPRMGADARLRVLHGFTEREVIEAVKALYLSMLAA